MNQRYGLPLQQDEVAGLMQLLEGHPYLTRLAFYTIVRDKVSIAELQQSLFGENSPFISHLRHLSNLLMQNDELVNNFKHHVLQGKPLGSEDSYRLSKAGLIRKMGHKSVTRCSLYDQYFALVL